MACGTGQSTDHVTRARSLGSSAPTLFADSGGLPVSREGETVCLDGAAETSHEAGSPLWLHSYAGPEITGLRRDEQGRAWVTQSGASTRLLAADGTEMWSLPFGELVALAPGGEAYVAGEFTGNLSLGGHELTTRGERDVYVARVSSSGEVTQVFTLGSTEDDDVQSLAVDGQGSILVSGAGVGTQKLAPEGTLTWQKPFFGELAVDSQDSIVVAGALTEPSSFGGGNLSPAGSSDVLVVKLDAEGRHVFSKNFGDSGNQAAHAVAIAAGDDILVGGVFDGSIDFGAGALNKPEHACSGDAWCATFGFVALLDAQGGARFSASLGPMRGVGAVLGTEQGDLLVSATLPGGVRPFRRTWLGAFDAQGAPQWQLTEWPGTGIGGGHSLALGACGSVLWGVDARPDLSTEPQSFLAAIWLR